MFPTLTINPETLAHLRALASDEEDYQSTIMQAREYHDGVQFVHLTNRLREFLGGDVGNTSADHKRLRVNVTRIVTTAVTERLLVSGFDTNEQGLVEPILDDAGEPKQDADGAPLTQAVKPVAAWAWQTWQDNEMDGKQARVHIATCRDRESFVEVAWDVVKQRPMFYPYLRYVDQSVTTYTGADVGEGCKAFYRNDDEDQDLLLITKRWTEVWTDAAGTRQQRQRLNVYFPDRIEKYAGIPAEWKPFKDTAAEPWPIPWVDAAGLPLGIPIIHFRSSAGMEAEEAWPAQNAINYLSVLELTAADMTAFRILVALGWEPVDADGNPLTIQPGTWVGTKNKDGKVQDIPPADIAPISNLIDGWIFRAAMVTDTPVSRFVTTKQIASEGTQKQGEGPLVNKIRNRQREIGGSWRQAIMVAVRLANVFGGTGLDEGVALYTKWESAEARDRDKEIERAQKLLAIGIPFKQVAIDLGFDAAQVEGWVADAEARKKEEMEVARQASKNGSGVMRSVS
jgi:hypothetical protein